MGGLMTTVQIIWKYSFFTLVARTRASHPAAKQSGKKHFRLSILLQ